MSAENYPECIALVLKDEGGYVNNPKDPGGATKFGITRATLGAYLGRPAQVQDVRAMTVDTAQRIYMLNYWNAVQGDALPDGVDYCVFDFAVNSGPKRAIIGLQRALDIADDGVLGPITLASIRSTNLDTLIMGITADRLGMLRKLSTWPTFGKGWTRRVAGVQKAAHNMLLSVRMADNGKDHKA